ncbi:HINT domain-containing protein [Pseudomonas mosselii]|nr:HINT domain-containing protein [Pseudomonas mosselii]MCU9540214.1 HINT domain-containing protein [Pseudomonas mosselii]MCU9545922.1 HINT domain-containing protein [Pseudomonas mosselii]MCU9551777.1 HINT domain-containing protein [Pseudomonas mosselii]
MAGGRGVVAATGGGKGKSGEGKVSPGEGAKVPPCPRCFAAGTLVATPDGDRAIETLKVGDLVWTKPEHGGKPFAAAITATHERDDQPIYRLALESTRTDGAVRSETLLVTPSHPFYVPAKRDFVQMGELQQGDLLQSLADGEGEGTSTRVVSARLYKPVGKTFNLTVDVGHTFYVGDLRTWVHNTGGPCDNPVGVKDGTFPDEVFSGKKPHQTTPGTKTTTQERYNPKTGKLEKSVIEYDQYGRQVRRTDYTNHGYGNKEKPDEYHSDPHVHIYEYGPGYSPKGSETRINND